MQNYLDVAGGGGGGGGLIGLFEKGGLIEDLRYLKF